MHRAAGLRVAINLESLVRGYGLELSEALSRYVLAGVLTRNEARRAIGYPGRPNADALWQPINTETTDQAQQRQDRADAQAEAAAQEPANSNANVAAGLSAEQLFILREIARDMRLAEGTNDEANADHGPHLDLAEPAAENPRETRPFSEAAE